MPVKPLVIYLEYLRLKLAKSIPTTTIALLEISLKTKVDVVAAVAFQASMHQFLLRYPFAIHMKKGT